MYTTKEYLKADPWEAVINRINSEYLTELTAYSTRLVSIASMGGTKTVIEVEPNIAESDRNTMPPVERTSYTYDRLDLATFFTNTGTATLGGFRLPTNTFRVLEQIAELSDIVFTLNDFEHVQYDAYNTVYVLKANPKSLRFVGEFRLTLVNTTKELLQNQGNKVSFATANRAPLGTSVGTIYAQYVTAGYDFTEEREYLVSITNDSVWPPGRKLAGMISKVTGYPWVCESTVADWNIAYENKLGEPKVSVLYNGVVLPRYTPRTDIQRVCVLRLGGLSSNVSGYLLLHYN